MSDVAVTGIGEAVGERHDSLETLIFRSAKAALDVTTTVWTNPTVLRIKGWMGIAVSSGL